MQLLPQELEIETALRDKKLSVASDEELDQLFRNIFMLIGLRPQFIPNRLEFIFLYDFVRSQYGGHTLSEIKLAFTKAAKGDLSEDIDDLKLYDYFTPAYFGMVMTKYRHWAREAGNKISDKIYVEQLKALDYQKPPTEIEWRQVVEQDYQFFLSNVDASSTYPEQHYDTLVEDEFIKEDFWQKKVQSVRVNILNDLNKGLAALEMSNLEKPDNYKNLHETRATIQKYKQGECEKELKAIAKQKVVLAFFKYNRDLGNKNIYQPQ
jgi:hypothetical protein